MQREDRLQIGAHHDRGGGLPGTAHRRRDADCAGGLLRNHPAFSRGTGGKCHLRFGRGAARGRERDGAARGLLHQSQRLQLTNGRVQPAKGLGRRLRGERRAKPLDVANRPFGRAGRDAMHLLGEGLTRQLQSQPARANAGDSDGDGDRQGQSHSKRRQPSRVTGGPRRHCGGHFGHQSRVRAYTI